MRLKYALRSLLASPSFTVGSILCLSIGLACTIAAFSLINAVMFRSMPGIVDQPSLRNVWTGKQVEFGGRLANVLEHVPEEAYRAYQQALDGVADLLAYRSRQVVLHYDGTPQAARAVYVSPNYFDVLGTQPAIGRLPDRGDTEGVLVSDRFWRTQMAARPDAIGRIVQVGSRTFRVAAIAPPKFVGVSRGEFEDDPQRIPAIWLPLATLERGRSPEEDGLRLVARLRSGTPESVLEERAQGTARGLAASDPVQYRGAFVRVRPLHRGPFEQPAETAMVIAAVMTIPIGILLIGCANVANLLLARGTARAREVAVRLALGASRRRVVVELLLESVLLALGAAAVGLALCAALIRIAENQIPFPVALDWRVAGFAGAAAGATAVLFGLLPALASSRAPMTIHFADARRVRTTSRRVLVVVQLAVSTALVVVTALLTRSVINVTAPRGDADETRIVALSYDLQLADYDRSRSDAFARELLEAVRGIPGVEAAGISSDGPFQPREHAFVREDDRADGNRRLIPAATISDDWLQIADIQLLAGREFTVQERESRVPTAALVNDALARRYWPDANPLGRTLTVMESAGKGATLHEIPVVGVVSGGLNSAAGRTPGPRAYLASAAGASAQTLWVRTRGDAANVLPSLRLISSQIGPAVPITRLETAAEARLREASPYWWVAQGMATAGALSLGLAALGLFSLLSYLVAQRRREVGVRMALGARPRDIVRLIVGESAWVAAGGAVAGSAIAALAATGLDDLFVGIATVDPLSFIFAALVLIATALGASAQPALRAARTDPASVLRAE